MRTHKYRLLLAAFCLAGCFDSDVPIAGRPEAFDSALVGVWEPTDTGADAADRFSVLRFDDAQYYVEMPYDLPDDTTRMRARAYLSDVAGTTFINLQDIASAERKYGFYKLTRHDNASISLQSLKSEVPRFTTSTELYAYLQAHSRDTALYDAPAHFRKVTAR